MQNFGENYRGSREFVVCPLCNSHLDSQQMSFNCNEVKNHVKIIGKYEDLFQDNIEKTLAQTALKITEFRSSYTN